METATFTDTHVTVPSDKPFEEVIQAVESLLGEGDIQSFARMVESSGSGRSSRRKPSSPSARAGS